jgi:hypothetical protein
MKHATLHMPAGAPSVVLDGALAASLELSERLQRLPALRGARPGDLRPGMSVDLPPELYPLLRRVLAAPSGSVESPARAALKALGPAADGLSLSVSMEDLGLDGIHACVKIEGRSRR